jgi:hypothetical protein
MKDTRDNLEISIDAFVKSHASDPNVIVLNGMWLGLRNCDGLLRPSDDKENANQKDGGKK